MIEPNTKRKRDYDDNCKYNQEDYCIFNCLYPKKKKCVLAKGFFNKCEARIGDLIEVEDD